MLAAESNKDRSFHRHLCEENVEDKQKLHIKSLIV